MNIYLTSVDLENMSTEELQKTYRQLFNLVAQKERAIDELYSLYRALHRVERALQIKMT